MQDDQPKLAEQPVGQTDQPQSPRPSSLPVWPEQISTPAPAYVGSVDLPPGRTLYRTIIEISGVLLAVVLLIGLLTNTRSIGQVALLVFAAIGVWAVAKEFLQSGKKSAAVYPTTYLPSDPEPSLVSGASGPVSSQSAVSQDDWSAMPKNNHKPRSLIMKLGIGIVLLIAAVYVLPFVGFFLLIMVMMIMGGGDIGS